MIVSYIALFVFGGMMMAIIIWLYNYALFLFKQRFSRPPSSLSPPHQPQMYQEPEYDPDLRGMSYMYDQREQMQPEYRRAKRRY